ncbi:cupin domain-containing protein [Rubrobacter taiwanensis]|jgi:uncharacterized protein YjlB|uniref:Cupin domain-containing protein n=1 Tax=Rubrobacter taiwanensis TaxID=185139 RepID=A0A4R1BLG7_9ACTN|nr:cupin domain-containing protein [Rubrobacter taiwanensis]TCJ18118.1 cupin domain-containing protein [Rubrobacter taiwanensis]
MSRSPDVEAHLFEDDGRIPNNPRLPLLLYRRALPASEGLRPECEKLFRDNGWGGIWVNGVFPYHHYHSTAHEALGVVRGSARITFGGESGVTVEVAAGDVAVIPAGVGHCNAGSSGDFTVVGAYPRGQSWDLRTGEPGERPEVLENIRRVPLPETDPLFGENGPLAEHWRMS